ncbi:GNAT family N-acetyltransferase [Haloarcula amylovorans]|uniref:GNAT family N-acetyltransferase n=1 Tax=Haloarcula amylovorans TaxID=2562280 RepID=UPI001075D870|nr:GNAT family N-acetyltransferase [Halomicroarcula amylolytica]
MSSDTTSRETVATAVEQVDDPDAWDSFVRRCDGPPFALWGWSEAAATYGHERWHLALRANGEIVAGIPVVAVESQLFGSKLVSPPYGERGSVLTTDAAPADAERRLLERVRDLADDRSVDFVSLRGRDLGDVPEFESRTRFVTFSIPVTDEASMWEAIKDSRSRQIRQAEENDALTYTVGTSVDDLREYYRLYLRSVRGHGTPPHAFEFYRTIWDRLADAGDVHLGMVRRNGELINGIINFTVGDTVFQWGVVTDYERRDLNGGSLLIWKTLQQAANEGYDAYELGRTREGSGVYMFKKSFGGEKTWYDDYHYFPTGDAELPHPDADQYERLKEIWKRLPVPVTRVLGPPIRQSVTL